MYISARSLGLSVAGSSGNDELIVRCPFPEHDDRSPSASFNSAKGVIYCFGCGQSATANQVADLTGGYVQITNTPDTAKRIPENLWRQLLRNNFAYRNEYLSKRYVSDDLVTKFGIRANANSIIFPFRKNSPFTEDIVGVQIRQFTKRPKYLTFGEKVPLWPLDAKYNTLEPLIICEGIFSALRLIEFGYQSYATLGAMIKTDAKDYLRKYTKVIGIFDDDKAGYLACGRLLKLAPHSKVLIRGIDVGDVLDKRRFLEYTGYQRTTSNLSEVAKMYGDKKEFFYRLRKVS